MPSLVETLRQREAEQQAAAARKHAEALKRAQTLDEYRALLAKGTGGKKEADALAALVQTLGISLADVEADIAAAAELRATEARILTDEQTAAARQKKEAADAALKAEQVQAFTRLAERVSAWGRELAFEKVMSEVVSWRLFGNEESDRLEASNLYSLPQQWRFRREDAERDLKNAIEDQQKLKATAERLRREHPRLLAGLEAVEGTPGDAGAAE